MFPQRTVSGIDRRSRSRSQMNACSSWHGRLNQPSGVRRMHLPSADDDRHGHHERTRIERRVNAVCCFHSMCAYQCVYLLHRISRRESTVGSWRESSRASSPGRCRRSRSDVRRSMSISLVRRSTCVSRRRLGCISGQESIHLWDIDGILHRRADECGRSSLAIAALPCKRIQNPD